MQILAPLWQSRGSLCRRQGQLGAQAADRGVVELQLAAVKRCKINDNCQSKAGAGLALVEPFAAPGDQRALLSR